MSNVRIPDLETRKRLLKNLRQARLGVVQSNLELDEVIARLEQHHRQQKLQRLKQAQFFNQSQDS